MLLWPFEYIGQSRMNVGSYGVMYRSARGESINVDLFTPGGLSNSRVAFDVGSDVVVCRDGSSGRKT